MGNFHDANYNITKIRTSGGDIVELELNNKPVALTTKLLCFKHSSSYLYVKNIPTENTEGVTAYTGGAIAKVTADYNVKTETDAWVLTGSLQKYDKYGNPITPKGSSGSSVDCGSYVLASDDKFYAEDSDKWYQVLEFGKTQATMVISDEEVTDETLLTELEAATPKTLVYSLYILQAGFTYSNTHYERYATGDVTIE